MRIGLQVALAFVIGFGILWGMRACDPFAYFDRDDKFILKGTVER